MKAWEILGNDHPRSSAELGGKQKSYIKTRTPRLSSSAADSLRLVTYYVGKG